MNIITSLDNSKNTLLYHVSNSIVLEIFETLEYTKSAQSNSNLIANSEKQFDWAKDRNAFQRLKNLANLPEKMNLDLEGECQTNEISDLINWLLNSII